MWTTWISSSTIRIRALARGSEAADAGADAGAGVPCPAGVTDAPFPVAGLPFVVALVPAAGAFSLMALFASSVDRRINRLALDERRRADALLDRLHRGRGALDEHLGRIEGIRLDLHLDPRLSTTRVRMLLHHATKPLRRDLGPVRVRVRQEDPEFAGAVARHAVRAARRALEDSRHVRQDLVGDRMAVPAAILVRVDIQHHDRHLVAIPLCLPQLRLERTIE